MKLYTIDNFPINESINNNSLNNLNNYHCENINNNNLYSNTDSTDLFQYKNNNNNNSNNNNNFNQSSDLSSSSASTSYSMNNSTDNQQQSLVMDSTKIRWSQPYQPPQDTSTSSTSATTSINSSSENTTCNNSPVSSSTNYIPTTTATQIVNTTPSNILPSNSPNVLSAINKKRQRDDDLNSNSSSGYIDPFFLRDEKDYNNTTNINAVTQIDNNNQFTNDSKELNIKIKKDSTKLSTNLTTNNTTAQPTQLISGNLKLPSIHHLEFESSDRSTKKDDNTSSSASTLSTNVNISSTTANTTPTQSTTSTTTANAINNTQQQQKKRKTKPSKYSITPSIQLTPTSSSTNSSIGASPINTSSNIPYSVANNLSSNSLQSYMNPMQSSSEYNNNSGNNGGNNNNIVNSNTPYQHSPTASSTASSSVTSPLINQYGTNPTMPTMSNHNQFYNSLTGQTTDSNYNFQSPVILSPFQKSHTPTNTLNMSNSNSSGNNNNNNNNNNGYNSSNHDLNDYISLSSNNNYYNSNTGSGITTPQSTSLGHSPSHNDYSNNNNVGGSGNKSYDPTSSLSLLSSLGDNKSHGNNNNNNNNNSNYYSSIMSNSTASSSSSTLNNINNNNNNSKVSSGHTGSNYHDQISQSHLYQNNFTYYDQSFPHPPVKKTHRRRPANIDKSTLYCHNCGTKNTPEWRRGPSGPATLCNACGLAYAKKQREEETNLHKLLLHSNSYSYHRGNMLESYVTPSLLPLFNTAANVPYLPSSSSSTSSSSSSTSSTPSASTPSSLSGTSTYNSNNNNNTNSYNIPNATTQYNTSVSSTFKPLTFSALKTPDRNLNNNNNNNKPNYSLNGSI